MSRSVVVRSFRRRRPSGSQAPLRRAARLRGLYRGRLVRLLNEVFTFEHILEVRKRVSARLSVHGYVVADSREPGGRAHDRFTIHGNDAVTNGSHAENAAGVEQERNSDIDVVDTRHLVVSHYARSKFQ